MKWTINDFRGVEVEVTRWEYIYINLSTTLTLIRTSYFADKDYKRLVLDAAEMALRDARRALITVVS